VTEYKDITTNDPAYKYAISQAPFRSTPGGILTEQKYIPQNGIVKPTGNKVTLTWYGNETVWEEIIYREITGWCYSGYLDTYEEVYPNEVDIPIATPSEIDAAQYIIYENHKKYNQCGEICVAFIVGDDLLSLLDTWKLNSPKYYERIYKYPNDKGTGIGDLDNLLNTVYGYSIPSLKLVDALNDPVIGRAMLSQERLMNLLVDGYSPIIGVRISGTTGRLQSTGVSHWVVPTRVFPNGTNRGFVELYNPFPNRKELYSWDEFYKAVGSPWGICVKK
jgi:hypothetical protein